MSVAIERCTYCNVEHEVTTITVAGGIVIKTCPSIRDNGSLIGGAWNIQQDDRWRRVEATNEGGDSDE